MTFHADHVAPIFRVYAMLVDSTACTLQRETESPLKLQLYLDCVDPEDGGNKPLQNGGICLPIGSTS
jgi:hypothetical protein